MEIIDDINKNIRTEMPVKNKNCDFDEIPLALKIWPIKPFCSSRLMSPTILIKFTISPTLNISHIAIRVTRI